MEGEERQGVGSSGYDRKRGGGEELGQNARMPDAFVYPRDEQGFGLGVVVECDFDVLPGKADHKIEGTGQYGEADGDPHPVGRAEKLQREKFDCGIANEFFPLVLFIGIGAMIDFGPVLTNPKLMLFGAAAQFGIFFTLCMATLCGFGPMESASIAIIGAADGPTSIVVANHLGISANNPGLFSAIVVAAYSYMALVPIIQRPVIKLITTKHERLIRMEYEQRDVSKLTRILFPIVITFVVGIVAPGGLPLIACLMFGNLLRECGVLNALSETAQKVLANLITLFLGLSIAATMSADKFLRPQTLLVLGLGLVAFVFDTVGGVFFAKFINLFAKKKINPMIGAAGISAFPMSARVVHKLGQEEDNQNFLLMHAVGANVSGQIASVIAGGLILSIFGSMLG